MAPQHPHNTAMKLNREEKLSDFPLEQEMFLKQVKAFQVDHQEGGKLLKKNLNKKFVNC